jgi:hypothetical protein
MGHFDFSQTESFKLLEAFRLKLESCLVISNDLLPEQFQDANRGGRTIARLNELCDKRDGITDHKRIKAIKAANIELYAKQAADGGEITYDGQRDENQQYKNEMTLISAMINGGIMEADELEEE